jgi:hypothetical protein
MVFSTCLLLPTPAFSDTEQAITNQGDTSESEVSIDALDDLKHANGASLGMAADYTDRNANDPDRAIALCRNALEKDNDDIDLHLQYAQLLEDKFNKQGAPDSQLYNECVREWLIVLRDEAGDEKGLTFHGIGLPLSGQLYNDEDRTILARKHLVTLTGIAPKVWETDTKYMEKVTKRSAVKGKLLSKTTQKSED